MSVPPALILMVKTNRKADTSSCFQINTQSMKFFKKRQMLPMALAASAWERGCVGAGCSWEGWEALWGQGQSCSNIVKAAVTSNADKGWKLPSILNGMNRPHGLAKYSFADACLWGKDDRLATFITLCSGEEEQDMKTNIANPFRRYSKLQSELNGKPEGKNGRGKIQRKPLVRNLGL